MALHQPFVCSAFEKSQMLKTSFNEMEATLFFVCSSLQLLMESKNIVLKNHPGADSMKLPRFIGVSDMHLICMFLKQLLSQGF